MEHMFWIASPELRVILWSVRLSSIPTAWALGHALNLSYLDYCSHSLHRTPCLSTPPSSKLLTVVFLTQKSAHAIPLLTTVYSYMQWPYGSLTNMSGTARHKWAHMLNTAQNPAKAIYGVGSHDSSQQIGLIIRENKSKPQWHITC